MEKREYKNGEQISIIGFGGIIVMDELQKDADNYVAEAIDSGIDYFDIAPSYGDAQQKLGPALRGKRQDIFLACKTEKRTAKEAEEALHDSLKNLETDCFDLYQIHGLQSADEAEEVLGPKGAMEAVIKAKEKGYIRYIGYSTHSEDASHLMMDQFDFDSVLFPVNWACHFGNGFGKSIMDKAVDKKITRLALKAMAKTLWTEENKEKKYPKAWYKPIYDKEFAKLAMRYTLSQPITAAVTPGDIEHMRWALEVGNSFKPVTDDEVSCLKEKSMAVAPIFNK